MKTNFHTHNYRCGHAVGNVEDYVKVAIDEGYYELGISDHAPVPSYYEDRMKMEELGEYLLEIGEAQKKYEDKIKIYNIAESSVHFENENLLNKQIIKQYIQSDKIPKISTLVLIDLEEKEILRTYNKIKKLFNFINIVKVEHLVSFKKIISKISNDYEQILLISSSKFVNTIKNFSDIPIYHFEIEKEKGALKNRIHFLKQMIYLRTMMLQHLEFKKERKIFPKKIKN